MLYISLKTNNKITFQTQQNNNKYKPTFNLLKQPN